MQLGFFKVLGVLVAFYTAYAAVSGKVYVKAGAGGKTVTRAESPGEFWVSIVIYAVLSVALMIFF
jgi:hypothetical protein